MTRSEFINEAKSFSPGILVIVSGKDQDDVMVLLDEARTAIEGEGNQSLVYGSRDTVVYPQRGYETDVEEAVLFEFVKVVSEDFVVLVGNEFDRNNLSPHRTWTVEIDVAMDIMDKYKVKDITRAYSRNISDVRELWSFMDKLYWFDVDTDTVTHIKNLDSFR
jgi:hypothetical protein